MKFSSQSASRALLAFCALVLASGGAMHALAFRGASSIADQSALPAFFVGAFKGLWLSDSASSLIFALLFAFIAMHPGWVRRPLLWLLSVAPIIFAAVIFSTMGSFFAGYLMLLSGGAALLGAGLHQKSRA
jgi:hypothetical protein